MSAPARSGLEFAWGFHERVRAAFFPPLDDMRSVVRQATAGPALVDANDPSYFQRACMLGLAAVTDIALDTALPEPIRAVLRDLPHGYQDLLSRLQPAAQAVAAAAPDVRNIPHLEGLASLFHQNHASREPFDSGGRGGHRRRHHWNTSDARPRHRDWRRTGPVAGRNPDPASAIAGPWSASPRRSSSCG